MRILEFITPTNIGGAENYVLSLSGKLKEKGHEVFILASGFSDKKNNLINAVDFFKKGGFDADIVNIGCKYNPLAILKLVYYIKKNKIDIIHTSLSKANIIGGIASKLLRVKSVSTAHGLNKKSQYRYSDAVICVSMAVMNNLSRQGVKKDKLHLVYNGIDTSLFDPESPAFANEPVAAPAKKRGEDWLNVGIIARLSREKGVDLFLDAARAVLDVNPGIRFFIAGAGILKDELSRKAMAYGIDNSVYFMGFIGDNLPFFINELDIVVFPSLKEGLPLSLLEAMSMGKVVIVTNVGGMPEVVADGRNGFIVEKGDFSSIADKIVHLFNERSDMVNIGKEARKSVLEKFNVNLMANKTEELFHNILK